MHKEEKEVTYCLTSSISQVQAYLKQKQTFETSLSPTCKNGGEDTTPAKTSGK